MDNDELLEAGEAYVTNVVLDAFESADPPVDPAAHPFDALTPFREFGVDSFLILQIIRRLEGDFGSLPKTLLFEYFNIAELAGYFVENHQSKLAELVTDDEPVSTATGS